jgi:hypothetical protein
MRHHEACLSLDTEQGSSQPRGTCPQHTFHVLPSSQNVRAGKGGDLQPAGGATPGKDPDAAPFRPRAGHARPGPRRQHAAGGARMLRPPLSSGIPNCRERVGGVRGRTRREKADEEGRKTGSFSSPSDTCTSRAAAARIRAPGSGGALSVLQKARLQNSVHI